MAVLPSPTLPTSDAICKSWVVTCISDPPAINQDFLFGIDNLLEWLTDLRKRLVLKGIIKGTDAHPGRKDTYIGGRGCRAPTPSLGEPLFQHPPVFSSLQAF